VQACSNAQITAARSGTLLDDNGNDGCSREEKAVGWVFLEVAVVLAIAVAIVWWTFPRKPRGGRADEDKGRADRES
jgi:hypothetical protein